MKIIASDSEQTLFSIRASNTQDLYTVRLTINDLHEAELSQVISACLFAENTIQVSASALRFFCLHNFADFPSILNQLVRFNHVQLLFKSGHKICTPKGDKNTRLYQCQVLGGFTTPPSGEMHF